MNVVIASFIVLGVLCWVYIILCWVYIFHEQRNARRMMKNSGIKK